MKIYRENHEYNKVQNYRHENVIFDIDSISKYKRINVVFAILKNRSKKNKKCHLNFTSSRFTKTDLDSKKV